MPSDSRVKHILWRKWRDPFNPKVAEDSVGPDAEKDSEYRFGRDAWTSADVMEETGDNQNSFKGRILAGPFGIIPVNQENTPSNNWNLWVGHSNFKITNRMAIAIETDVAGVEVLKCFSPYRFWIGIGENFDEDEVKAAILATVNGPLPIPSPIPGEKTSRQPPPPETKDSIRTKAAKAIAASLREKPFWAIGVDAQGKLVAISGAAQNTVDEQLKLATITTVISSWGK